MPRCYGKGNFWSKHTLNDFKAQRCLAAAGPGRRRQQFPLSGRQGHGLCPAGSGSDSFSVTVSQGNRNFQLLLYNLIVLFLLLLNRHFLVNYHICYTVEKRHFSYLAVTGSHCSFRVYIFLILFLIRITLGFIVMQITCKRLTVSSDFLKIISTTDWCFLILCIIVSFRNKHLSLISSSKPCNFTFLLMSITPDEKAQAAAFPVPAGNADCPAYPSPAQCSPRLHQHICQLLAATWAPLHLRAHSALEIK